jgi:antitoxin HicB
MINHNPSVGSSLDDFLAEEGLLSEVNAVALKRVLTWQISQAMESQGLSKAKMATAMNTSRSALDRLLDADNIAVTLKTLDRAATALGKRLQIELVDET